MEGAEVSYTQEATTDLFLEAAELLGSSVREVEALDGHIAMPVATVNLSHRSPTNQLHALDVSVRDVPLIHHTVPLLRLQTVR